MRCLTSGTEIHRVSLLHHSGAAGRSAKISARTSAAAGEDTAMAFRAEDLSICNLGNGVQKYKYVFLNIQSGYLTFKKDNFLHSSTLNQ